MSEREASVCERIQTVKKTSLPCTQCGRKKAKFKISWKRFFEGAWVTGTIHICKKKKCLKSGIEEAARSVDQHVKAQKKRRKTAEEIAAGNAWRKTKEQLSKP